jgi:hypothetical protein
MEMYETLCALCRHRHQGTHPPTCDAFPSRIPLEVRLMRVDHRHPYPGDNNITFQPRDDSEETRQRLARVTIRSPRRRVANDLDRRVEEVLGLIAFKDHRQRFLFLRAVRKAETFDGLSPFAQALLVAGEAAALGLCPSSQR